MNVINPKIFKAYDIRGLYPDDINEETIIDITKAIYSFFVEKSNNKNLSIVLGRDMRISGPQLYEVVKQTLLEIGATVIDAGLISTPTMYYSVFKGNYDAGIQITASHNPKEYSGLKFLMKMGNKALKVSKNTGMEDVKRRAIEKDFIVPMSSGKIISQNDILKEEVKDAIKIVNPNNNKRIKVVCDPANGMGSLYVDELCKQYGCDLVKMNFELDGTFPAHQPDPLQFELLKDLQKKVISEHADFGIAPDGDGDRVFFIDEKGEVIPATMITSLISKEILQDNPGETIVVDIRYTQNAKNIIEKYGGKISICPVGHALITKQVNDENAIFAGESSGHFYYRDIGGAESAIRAILYVMKVYQEENKPLSEILASFKTSFESGEFNFVLPEGTDSKKVLETIVKTVESGSVSWFDGLSIDYPNWRVSIRTSNTEPLMRLNLEAENESLMEQKKNQFIDLIISLGGKLKK